MFSSKGRVTELSAFWSFLEGLFHDVTEPYPFFLSDLFLFDQSIRHAKDQVTMALLQYYSFWTPMKMKKILEKIVSILQLHSSPKET